MNKVNIAFAFDLNYYKIGLVTINSLLISAKEDTFYEIFCIIGDDIKEKEQNEIKNNLSKYASKFNLNFINTSSYFDNVYESRGITKASYFRLALHRLVNVDKIIYSDVDIIFKEDLYELYSTNIDNYIVGGVIDIFVNLEQNQKQFSEQCDYWRNELLGIEKNYINAGFLLMNLKYIRESDFEEKISKLINREFLFHDQDILNIYLNQNKDKLLKLPLKYNIFQENTDDYLQKCLKENIIRQEDIDEVKSNPCVLHFVGQKPWKEIYKNNAIIWWDYLEKYTDFYDEFNKKASIIKSVKTQLKFQKLFKYESNVKRVKITLFNLFSIRFSRKLFK